jgi:hypothetical protein
MRLGAATLTLALATAATARAARADGVYFSEAFGPGTIENDLSSYADSSFRIRIGLGYRNNGWALEGFVAPEFMFHQDAIDGPSMIGYGLDLKKIMKVSEHASVYVRGSMSRLSDLSSSDYASGCGDCIRDPGYYYDALQGYSGRGLGVGVGAQVSGKVPVIGLLAWPLFFTNAGPKMTGALFIEESYDFYRLQPPQRTIALYQPSVDASITRWTIGFAFGSDF